MKLLLMISAILTMASCSPKLASEPVQQGSELGFSISIFRNALKQSGPDANVVISPYSAGVALSMLAQGAQGQSWVELDNALNACTFKKTDLGESDEVTVKSANSVWINDDFSVRNTYVDHLAKDYGAFADVMDFSDPESLRAINNWCSENTEGMIKGILDRLTPDMVMILTNALYFKAPWENTFNPEQTCDAVFHGSKGDKQHPFMSQKLTCPYAEYDGNKFLALPYKGGKYSMYILLPSEDMGMKEIESYVYENGFNELVSYLKPTQIRMSMPKFKIESEMSLVKTLEAMGVHTIFTSAADLSGIARGPLCVSDVYQKAVVDVDENGSEAAAVTAITVLRTSAPINRTPSVVLDRPFYFMIADAQAGRVLFAGRIMNL